MIKKIKQTTSEKFLLIFILILGVAFLVSFIIIKNKCLFVKEYNPEKIFFQNPENIAILKVPCGNVIIELKPEFAPNSVERFKMLIRSGKYNDIAFHRVIKDVLVQSGDLEFGKKNNINYAYIGTGESGYGTINSELNINFKFNKGSVALGGTCNINTEDSQFFILLQDAPLFEGEYSPLGRVLYGLEILEKIKHDNKVEYVLRPDFIISFNMLK